MSVSAWFVRYATYPLHERLRNRPTLRERRGLIHLTHLPPGAVRRHCAARLRALLRFSQSHLPYYATLFERCGLDPCAADVYAELAKLPILTKRDIRKNQNDMLCRAVPGGPIPHSSGGTTGDTLHFFIDRIRQAQPLAARLVMQAQFGVHPGQPRAYLWGSPIETRRSRVRRVRDRLLNEILLDAFEMSPDQMDRHLNAIQNFRPSVLYGYPTAAALLARHAAQRYGPHAFPFLRLTVLTGEEVTADQMAQVRTTFGCRVACEYGSREVGLIAHECPRGQLHVITPHVHLEIVRNGHSVAPGQCGEIICTTLDTRAQPLLRYRIGDVGTLSPDACPCGLPLPSLQLDAGKITGFIALPNGQLCHGAVTSHVLRDQPGIVEFKTHQLSLNEFDVLLVVDDRFDPSVAQHVQQRYRHLFGPHVRVNCRVVERIPPDPSGKRRYVVSDVAPDYTRFEVVGAPFKGD